MRLPTSRARGSAFHNQVDANGGDATPQCRGSTPEEPRQPQLNRRAEHYFWLRQIRPQNTSIVGPLVRCSGVPNAYVGKQMCSHVLSVSLLGGESMRVRRSNPGRDFGIGATPGSWRMA